jgi:hypothetical protein
MEIGAQRFHNSHEGLAKNAYLKNLHESAGEEPGAQLK